MTIERKNAAHGEAASSELPNEKPLQHAQAATEQRLDVDQRRAELAELLSLVERARKETALC